MSPKIRAQFVMENGVPAFIEQDNRKHYKIVLSVKDVPKNAESVVYKLHDTYSNPVREIFRRPGVTDFDERITSFGDFEIVTTISGSAKDPILTSATLSEALESWYTELPASEKRGVPMAVVTDALASIKQR